ncbi:MAG TPA: dihydrolipoamide acetyltransferase family protein [Albitalea sp.]
MASREHVIKMPDIGEGIAEVELVAWHVKPGDVVTEDQVLADVMTDKANVEIPSPVAGRVMSLGGEVGQTLAVGSELIRIEVASEADAAAAKAIAAGALAQAAATPPPADPHPVPLPPAGEKTQDHRPAPSPAGRVRGESAPSHPQTGAERLPLPLAGEEQGEGQAQVIDRPIASPAVRRRAWELGIDLNDVRSTGLAGRIVQADLDAYVEQGGNRTPPRSPGATPERPPTREPAVTPEPRTDETPIRVIGLRRKIAQKMQEAKRRIPHFTYVEELDVTELEALRARLNEREGGQRARLTVLPFIVRAVVIAVRDFPQVNARFDDEAGVVMRHGAVHVGIATQTDAGLMVPVLRHAEARDLWDCAAEIARLADTARGGRATRDELTGSTLTITSLGALGGIASTPVINHPEVAIVGVNRIVERPVMRGGAVVGRQMMNLSSSFDHRVVDGMDAAEFIQAIRGLLECPSLLFVE